MGNLDIAIVAVYLVAVTGIGLYFARSIKTEEDYIVAGRRMGPLWLTISAFASWTGLAGLFGTPEMVVRYGIAGAWWWYTFPIGLLLMGIFLAKIVRQRMHVTTPDIVAQDYPASVRVAASLVTSWNYLAWAAAQVFGISMVFTLFSGMDPKTGAIVAFLVVIVYTMLGGFLAVVATDVLQAVIFLIVIGVVAPLFVIFGPGVQHIYEATKDIPGFYDLFANVPPATLFVWFLLLPAGFIDTIGFQRVFSANSPDTARKGLINGFVIMAVFGVILTFLGVAAKALLPADANPVNAMPDLMVQLLPHGVIGILVAAFLAVAMSTASTTLLITATTLQRDVISRLRPGASDKERLWTSRILLLVLGLAALVVALSVPGIVTILMLGFSVYVPGLLLPVLSATFGWRIPSWSMLATIVVGAGSTAILVLMGEPGGIPASLIGFILSVVPFVAGLLMRSERQPA
ncbi:MULTISPECIES: sodium:solute symporter family protein [unclassified Mesorhizobium]|uniref:sodium:solute symporter family protein n=1 Tax=unclassified Mesorhizobium TaxID=325217 RepID=UPI0010940EEA|nr:MULTISPECIES: sodium:solute symporter family protein [unclassified Mesorhizobium]TGT87118.1 sodium:solute symporter family protein [Mesorhizobium sp. M8A.F.Ca.ET.161.01.1.1]TGV40983.1 sodium:solute symporter family protein [Mesorhizobium sp. M8A.F.Ca.ET.142.01.1.1]